MNVSGWIAMILSISFVTILMVWSISRVLGESKADKVHSQIDIHPKHTED